jgi:thiamine-phosphate pyrophosphorylase
MGIKKQEIDYSLYLVTDRNILRGKNFIKSIEEALLGGTTLLQLREKNMESGEFYNIALEVKKIAGKYDVPLIINDRLDIMLAVDADGLHIGQKDLPLDVTRNIIGKNKILGYSVKNVEQALYGQKFADYLGAGSVFATATKADIGKPIGIKGLKKIQSAVTIPVVGIGGINKNNIEDLKAAGIAGISLVSAVLGAEDIQKAAQEIKKLWK